MKRPRGEITNRLIANSAKVTEQTLRNSAKFLIKMLEEEDIKSFRRLQPLILILSESESKQYNIISFRYNSGIIYLKNRN